MSKSNRVVLLISDQRIFPDHVNIDHYMNRIAKERVSSAIVSCCKVALLPYPCKEIDVNALTYALSDIDAIEIIYHDLFIDVNAMKSRIMSLINKYIYVDNKVNICCSFEALDPTDLDPTEYPSQNMDDLFKFYSKKDNENKKVAADTVTNDNHDKKSEEVRYKVIDEEPKKKPKEIIALIGSRKFIDTFKEVSDKLSSKGNIVFIPEIFCEDIENLDDKTIHSFEELYNLKIKMSNKVLVINKDGYIGKDTKREIDYAVSLGKPIEYYEPPIKKPIENPINVFKTDIKHCNNQKIITAAVNFVESSYKYMRPWAEITQEVLNGKLSTSLRNIYTDEGIAELSKRPIDELTPLEIMLLLYKKVIEHPDEYDIKELQK